MKDTPHPTDVIIGNNLARLRKAKGLSLEALGERVGVSFQQLQKYSSGANRISASMADMLCQALGCHISDLFAGTAATGCAPLSLPQASPQAMKLATAFDRIKGAQTRQSISRIVTAIIAEQAQDEPEQADDLEPDQDIAA
ncbi:transcriptional regulator with XRE-family HTH domain [Peteryoungia aggregata LMG 23059]|uniref:Transcriptional regulator with XRE-family HTH domain n=1 Tax=Peteryoungia aggregata LMG 23059 TaxID=1368425 RepID=A0ABU0GAG2_9HYPH|nr:helix-turn-helix transcriptional regulator [Peteryoungia aggregata]MDQ0422343.1 transcriptional regulator with XRE-family HTH domain [Peteryoungia aggregata LMG 23059]